MECGSAELKIEVSLKKGLRYFLTTPCHIYIRAASMFLSAHSIARQCLASEPYRVSCHFQVHQLSWWWKSELPRYTAAREVKCFWNALRITPSDHRVVLLLHFTSRAACQSPRASFHERATAIRFLRLYLPCRSLAISFRFLFFYSLLSITQDNVQLTASGQLW